MFGRIRQYQRRARRTWLGLIVLAFIGQPLLVLASALHQAEHELGSAAAAGMVIEDECPAPPTEGEGFWHELLHLLLCHGHLSMLPSTAPDWRSLARPQVYAAAVVIRYADRHPQLHLRPPIRG